MSGSWSDSKYMYIHYKLISDMDIIGYSVDKEWDLQSQAGSTCSTQKMTTNGTALNKTGMRAFLEKRIKEVSWLFPQLGFAYYVESYGLGLGLQVGFRHNKVP